MAATAMASSSSGVDEQRARDMCHEHLKALCLDMARETLRSDELATFHQSDRALYTHLADYFENMKERQTHEDAIAITPQSAHFVLRDVFGQAHLSSCTLNLAEKKALSALQAATPSTDAALSAMLQTVADTGAGPYASQRQVREQLQAAKVNVSALSEVLELCRLLDTRFGHSVPFGQVNVTHVAAVLCTLLPCKNLFELITGVFEALPPTKGGPGPDGRPGSARGSAVYRASDLQKIRVFHCWAAIDTENAPALRRLQLCLLQRPNLTLPLLLDAMPSIRLIGTIGSDNAAVAEGQQNRVVVYGDDDVVSTSVAGPKVAAYSEDAEPSNNEDDDEEGDGGGGGDAFWQALVAPNDS
jgi:hypothetical protein